MDLLRHSLLVTGVDERERFGAPADTRGNPRDSSIDTEVGGQAIETLILYPGGQDGPSWIELADTKR